MYKLRVKIGRTKFIKTFNNFDAAKKFMKDFQNRFISVEFQRINF